MREKKNQSAMMPYAQNYFVLTTYCKLHFKVRGTNEIVFATPKLTGNAHWIRYSTTEITIVVRAIASTYIER